MRYQRLSNWLLSLFTISVLSLSTGAEGATLHAVLVCDVDDYNIGEGVEKDLQNFHKEVLRIAQNSELELSETILSGIEYNPMVVMNAIGTLHVSDDDVVIYYHCAHGFRTPETSSPWPALFFGWGHWALKLDDIVAILKKKRPRLTIVLADVCNNCVSVESAPQVYDQPLDKGRASIRSFYRHLYRDFSGVIIACGAKPGQFSWITSEEGSFFTNSFLKVCRESSKRDMVDWDFVMEQTAAKTLQLTQSFEEVSPQEPYSSVDVCLIR